MEAVLHFELVSRPGMAIRFKPNPLTTIGDIVKTEKLLNKMAEGSGITFEIKSVWVAVPQEVSGG